MELDDIVNTRVYANWQWMPLSRGFVEVLEHGGDYYLYRGAFEANRLSVNQIYQITATHHDIVSDAVAYVRTADQAFSPSPPRPPLPPLPPPELPPDYCDVCGYEPEYCICDDYIAPPVCDTCGYELEYCICDDYAVTDLLEDLELYCNLYSEWRSAIYGPVSAGTDLDVRIVTRERLEPEEFARLRLRAVPTGNDRWGQPNESAAVSITPATITAETALISGETKYVYVATITVQEWSGGYGPWYRIAAYMYDDPDDFVFAQLHVEAGVSATALGLIQLDEESLQPEDTDKDEDEDKNEDADTPYPPDYDTIKDDDEDDYMPKDDDEGDNEPGDDIDAIEPDPPSDDDTAVEYSF